MQLKSYHGGSMRDVMRIVRDDLGDEAVIVSTVEGDDGHVRVTAALEKPDPPPSREPNSIPAHIVPAGTIPQIDGDLAGFLSTALDYHGVTTDLSERLVGRAMDAGPTDPSLALAAALDDAYRFAPVSNRELVRPLMTVGPAGAGKTMTTAKLAARLVLQGRTATVVNADVSRAAAADQLEALTTILGIGLETAATPGELGAIVEKLGTGDAVFVDSFAVNPFDAGEVARLADFIGAVGAEPVLVLGAGLDALEAAEIAEIFAALGAERMITTRIDASRRFGGLLAAAHAGGLAIAEAGVTPHVAHGLTALTPVSVARLLCRDPNTLPSNSATAHEEVSE